MEENNEALPQDIQTEILLRMPVKSLGKSMCVSKKWAAIIREKNFRDRYFLQSMTRPRLLFAFARNDLRNVLIHSVYQEKEPLLSSGQQETRIPVEPGSEVCAVLRGLVCIKSAFKIILCNPCTKKFLALPELRERDHAGEVTFNKAYLGYDEATNVFKVLCQTINLKYRVFTVGSGEDCWRMIDYKPLHFSFTRGFCKDGVLYFGAISKSGNNSFVMSFNLRSEELNVIELPKLIAIRIGDISLVNYNGEIALVNEFVDENGEIRIWVRNEVAGDWCEERIVIPRWRETVGDLCKSFVFKGTTGTGELVFALQGYIEGSMFVLYYDRITQHLRKFEIEGVNRDTFHYTTTFLDHVDSLLLM